MSYPNPDPESGPGRTQIRHKIRPDSGYSYSFRKCNSKANPGELCKRSPKTHETQMTASVHYTSQWCTCTYTALPAPQASPSRHCLLRCCCALQCAGWHGYLRAPALFTPSPSHLPKASGKMNVQGGLAFRAALGRPRIVVVLVLDAPNHRGR